MSFLGKYQIVSISATRETNTYRAQEILTGRPVLVHRFLRGQTSPLQPDLISLIYTNLPGTGTPGTEHFLDSGEDGDQVFIVTSDVPECVDLRAWLLFIADSQGSAGTLPGPSANPPAAKPPEKRPRGQVPSGFQVVFQSRKQAPHAVEPGPTIVIPPRGPAATASHGAFAPDSSGSGKGNHEPSQRQSPAPPTPPSRVPAPPSMEKTGPGEFTQMFSATGEGPATGQPLPPSPPAPVKPPGATPSQPTVETDGPGEFTRMFSIPSHGMAEPPAPPATSPGITKPVATPAPSGQEQPGEFTALFLSPGQTTSKTEPPPSGPSQAPATPGSGSRGPGHEQTPATVSQSDSEAPGTFTRMFQTGGERSGGTRSPVLGSPAQLSVPQSSTAKKGPGELTLLMQGYKPPSATPPATALDDPKPPNPPPVTDSGKRAPGEFTMLFRQPSQPTASVSPAAPPPPVVRAAPPAPPAQQPGEYTSVFEAPRISPTAPQPGPQAVPPAGHSYPASPAAPPAPPAMPQPPQFQPPPPPAYPAAPQQPMPQMQPMAIPPTPAPRPAPPAGDRKPPMFWVMVMALGGLFLAALVLVLFFAFKH